MKCENCKNESDSIVVLSIGGTSKNFCSIICFQEWLTVNAKNPVSQKPIGWISVKDRLPEPNVMIIWTTKIENDPLVGWMNVGNRFIAAGNNYKTDDVGHWMPLPEPPKENDHGK